MLYNLVQRCKDICSNVLGSIRRIRGISPYKQGLKWCSVCRKFLQNVDIVIDCPCCGTQLRKKPRINRHYKELYNEFLGVKRIE